VNACGDSFHGEPDAENLHVRFDEGGVGRYDWSAVAKPRKGNLDTDVYRNLPLDYLLLYSTFFLEQFPPKILSLPGEMVQSLYIPFQEEPYV
jgi:hypothetical protein